MDEILKRFIREPMFDASASLLEHWKIRFSSETKVPISFEELYSSVATSAMPKSLKEVLEKISTTYFIGSIDDDTMQGGESQYKLGTNTEGKYQTMLVFAVDVKPGEKMTRTELATLTRGFNRIAESMPVILLIKNSKYLSLATCERSEYTQEWRNGEKLGKVSILRDINCENTHRGHRDILESIGDKVYNTFDEIYAHWLAVFSSELLTKKFYTELSEWYAWVIGSGEVKFPNDITTDEDDMKYNHEAVIRLITRLIFVWFLRQKKLVPEEFFDEKFVRDNFIENFDPHSENTLFYNPRESKYYRLILQNLFFAMLNRPIVDEESGAGENRRFATTKRYQGKSEDFNVNNLLRYKSEFKAGGAEKLLEIANAQIPFLNGGLFECLDHKDKDDSQYGFYFDGFSERKASLEQLSFPDYFFFGEKGEFQADLSKWYDDKKKKEVKVHGLVNILKHYNFTVEENTPFDQEVSLDPELLGKVFENLLASYNPETNTSARKQTGSFYTPREIVKYMVDESLIAHLCRKCSDIEETKFRSLLDYSVDNFDMEESSRKRIMEALYECKVLDPACGSGAFPMGMLQQMVHVLKKLDPSNKMWEEFILDLSLARDKDAYLNTKDSEELNRIRKDIEQAFNRSVNDPDYARKLYLIEHCIYGVDIQPIAVQISKLRFFISLVSEQKPTGNAKENFGIRPLPNLEAKFVAANTLIPLDEQNIFGATKELAKIKKELTELNHKLFIAKRNKDKKEIRNKITYLRKKYSEELFFVGAIGPSSAEKIAEWNMFDQNSSADFFDTEWMFGVKKGFCIIIGNPPYISAPAQIADPVLYAQRVKITECKQYETLYQKWDLYIPFMERGLRMLAQDGCLSMIVPFPLSNQGYGLKFRDWVTKKYNVFEISNLNGTKVFENATVSNLVLFALNSGKTTNTVISEISNRKEIKRVFIQPIEILVQDEKKHVWNFSQQERKSNLHSEMDVLGDFCYISVGMVLNADEKTAKGEFKKEDLISDVCDELHPRKYIEAKDIEKYKIKRVRYLEYDTQRCPGQLRRPTFRELYECPKLIFNRLGNLQVYYDSSVFYLLSDSTFLAIKWIDLRPVSNKSINSSIKRYSRHSRIKMEELSEQVSLEYLLAIMNSQYASHLLALQRGDDYHIYPEHIRNIPIPMVSEETQAKLKSLVEIQSSNTNKETQKEIDIIVYHLYKLKYEDVLMVDPETTITREEYESYE